MGYLELLPTPHDVSEELEQAGLTPAHRSATLGIVAHFLREHAQYYQYECQRIGEKEDAGSRDTLNGLATDFDEAARMVEDASSDHGSAS